MISPVVFNTLGAMILEDIKTCIFTHICYNRTFDGQSQKYEYQARKDGVPLVSDIWDQYVKLLLSARFSHCPSQAHFELEARYMAVYTSVA